MRGMAAAFLAIQFEKWLILLVLGEPHPFRHKLLINKVF